jgi:hypothetical protein
MSFEIHLIFENDEFLLQAFLIQTQEVVFLKMILESIVVDVVLMLAIARLSVTYVTSLMLVSAVGIQLIVPVEAFMTELAFWVAFETTLVNSTWVIIAELFVLAKLRDSKKFVFVCKDLFISSTQIAWRS